MKKYFLLSIISVLLIDHCHAQQYRQVDKNLNIFYKLNPSAKLSLFFNQPRYAPGDTAFFITRFVNSVDLKPIKKKSVLHLVLANNKGQKALEQYFFVEDGIASNQIIIPSTLRSGTYRILCSREQSNNFNQDLFYQQSFEIVGANKNIVVDTVQAISVFPEGGSIIDHSENKIFVSVRPARANLVKLFDGSNMQVAKCNTNSNGIGFIFFNPKSDRTFYLSAALNGNTIRVPLTIKKKAGVSFQSAIANGKLIVRGKMYDFHGNPEIILLRNDRVYYAEKIKLDSANSFSSEISLGETMKGLFQLWIIDASKVLASRILYSDPGNENDILTIKHPSQVHSRSKMEIILEKSDSLTKGDFSMRVYQKSLFAPSEKNIFSNFELFNDFSPQLPLLEKELSFDSINDFLATQQWQRYKIDSLAKGKFKIKKASFDQGYVIKGKCSGFQNPNPLKPVILTLYFENSNLLEETTLDKNGNFLIELTQSISINEKVYYRVDANETEFPDAKLEITKPDKILPVIQTRFAKEPDPYFSYKVLTDSIVRSYSYFSSEPKFPKSESKKVKSFEAKTYGADRVYNLNDYQVFSSMKDVIVEILGKVALRKINGKNSVRIYLDEQGNENPVLAKGDPLFIIDGIPTNNTDFFLALQPSRIEKIKIIWKVERSVLKSFGRNGVIIVETKDANPPANIPALNSFNLTGFSPSLPFKSIRNLNDSQFPYFRACQYWNPELKFDRVGVSSLSFFTTDDLGEYLIEVEGLTSDGAPYFNRSSFIITPQK